MAYSEPFNVDEGDFTLTGAPDIAWNATEGNPTGCIESIHASFPAQGGGTMTNGSISEVVAAGNVFSFNWRANITALSFQGDMITVQISYDEGGGNTETIQQPGGTGDTGWQTYTYTVLGPDDGKTVGSIQIGTLNVWLSGEGTIYIDNVYVGSAPASPFGYTRNAGGMPGSVMI